MKSKLEQCPQCETEVAFTGGECPRCHRPRLRDPVRDQPGQGAMEGGSDEECIRDRPISATLDGLGLGGVILTACTIVPAFFVGGRTPLSALFFPLGLAIVGSTIFGRADRLDQLRWRRYWRGHLFGALLGILAFACLLNSENSGLGWLVAFYLGISVAGFGVGFTNVAIYNKTDKARALLEWRWDREKEAESSVSVPTGGASPGQGSPDS